MTTTVYKYYVDDVGTEILVDTGVDITTATLVQLLIKKPGGTEAVWTGSVTATTKVRYYTVSGDFSEDGIYKLQAYVVMPTGHWRGNTTTFRVYEHFQ